MEDWYHVFVVYRIDHWIQRTEPEAPTHELITIKEVLRTAGEAAAEIERLRALNSDKGCDYFFNLPSTIRTGGSASFVVTETGRSSARALFRAPHRASPSYGVLPWIALDPTQMLALDDTPAFGGDRTACLEWPDGN